ncbi:MAG TPA: hypothetical protein VGT08_07930 [Terracidiphilus sp.]|nr:hypothetical protein [Terracidiphilus sp.]
MKILRVAMIGAVLITAASAALTGGQDLPAPSPPWASSMSNTSQKSDNSEWTQQQKKMRVMARQRQLAADADKLVALATDLKAQVDKSSPDKLSVDMIRKAAEIEKLAHRVKERMKVASGG